MRIAGILFSLLLLSCTKQPGGNQAQMVTPTANPDRVIFEADLNLPPEHKGKIKRTDLLMWALRDGEGKLLANHVYPVPKFPHHVTIQARQLQVALPENAVILFSARLVHFGDEYKPPAPGELNLNIGSMPSKDAVENPNVNQKQFEKWAKKNNLGDFQVLTIGAKSKGAFAPSIW